MRMLEEFKAFAVKGNVVDMAVGIIIGAAFGKIVSAMVNGLLMPPLGLLIGGVDFSDLGITLKAATADTDAVVWAYGAFIQTIIDFLIVAGAIFLLIKWMNALQKKAEEDPASAPPPPKQQQLLEEIRDLLKQQQSPNQ